MSSFGAMHGVVPQPGTPPPLPLGHPRTAPRMLLSRPCSPNAQLLVRVSGYNLWTRTDCCPQHHHTPQGCRKVQSKAGC